MSALHRKVIQEDVVQYKLFLIQSSSALEHAEEQLSNLLEEILATVAPFLVEYIWQNQPFSLKYHTEKGGVPAHIGGSTNFGDNVEDEWFIVYLLKKITEKFPELAAKVEDNDGDFLLIEAADFLPKWLNPDTSENRVFLYRGGLHILPCPSRSNPFGIPKDAAPTVRQALELLSTQPEACQAGPKISSAVNKRLGGYPEKIKTEQHRAHCFVPAGIALVLAQRPDLVASAVSAFYLRDPVDLQACRIFKTFPPDTRVLTAVTFTRCLYAQLRQQQFCPDRRSGFTLPPSSHPQYRAQELGMKLAHGFEILCSRCRLPSSEADTPISCNPQWKGFMESLRRNGYFRGEIEGSAQHRNLTRLAENFFKQTVASQSSVTSPGEEILQLLRTCIPFNLEELKKQEPQLPPEDSDSWLDITAKDLELLLQERSGGGADFGSKYSASTRRTQPNAAERTKESEGSKEEEEAGYSLIAVSQKMKHFLGATSSHEGAELPWTSSTQPFSFDPASLSSAVDQLLGHKEELDSDDLDDLEDSDDGEDVDDGQEDEEEEEQSCGLGDVNGRGTLDSLRKYMDQMDQELMTTNIGQSFSVAGPSKTNLDKKPVNPKEDGTEEMFEEEIQPLDVDVNLVTNLLESLSCQAGLAGPASNLLQSLGIQLPPNSDHP